MKKTNKMKSIEKLETFDIEYDNNSEMAKSRIKLNTKILESFKTASKELPEEGIDIYDVSSMKYIGLANKLLDYFGLTQNEYAKYGINNEYGYFFDIISFFRETTLTAEQFDEEIKWRQDLYSIDTFLQNGISSQNVLKWLRKQNFSGSQKHMFSKDRKFKLHRLVKTYNLIEFLPKNQ